MCALAMLLQLRRLHLGRLKVVIVVSLRVVKLRDHAGAYKQQAQPATHTHPAWCVGE